MPHRSVIRGSAWRPSPGIYYAILGRAWLAASAVLTIFLITRFFDPAEQGLYYTFSSLLALQVFVELGLGIVVLNSASHEWAHLHLDATGRIAGDATARSRLISLGRFIFVWYLGACATFVFAGGVTGFWFLSRSAAGSGWHLPWFAAVVATGGVLFVAPFLSLLEGCNQVKEVNRFRLLQAIAGSASLWSVMLLGGGLWAVVAMPATYFLAALCLLMFRYRHFLQPFLRETSGGRLHWFQEIWPLQWRIGIQGLLNYFMYSLFTPIAFYYSGAESAGRVGMTWQAVNGLQSLALAWVQVRIPRFGSLIVSRNFEQLDYEWKQATIVSTALVTGLAMSFVAAVYTLELLDLALGERLLNVRSTILLMTGLIFSHVGQCQALYLRAHKREVLTFATMVSAAAMAAAVWGLGSALGERGIAWAYFGVMTLVCFPAIFLVWRRFRSKWHRHEPASAFRPS